MSLNIFFHEASDGNDGPYSLASAIGWSLVTNWIDSLPSEGFDLCRQLAMTGEAMDTWELSLQLRTARDKFPPADPNVRHTLDDLIEHMGPGAEDEMASIISE